mgnify:CR=1 FL=1
MDSISDNAGASVAADTPRAIMLGALREARGLDASAIAALCSGEGHAPTPLSDEERARLETATLDAAPDHVRGDYPEWLAEKFALAFGERAGQKVRRLGAGFGVDGEPPTLTGPRCASVQGFSKSLGSRILPQLIALSVHSAIKPSGSLMSSNGLVGRVISAQRLLCLTGAWLSMNDECVFAWSTFMR